MPDPLPPTPPAPSRSSEPHPLPHLGEEFGTGKRNLPPAGILVIAVVVVGIVVAVLAFLQRAKPQGGGSIDDVAAAEIPGQNSVLVAINVTLRNSGEKPLWVRTIKGTLKTASGESSDEAASAVDFDRYFQAFPVLKAHATTPLTPETKIPPGGAVQGTVIFSFPVTGEGFNQRQSLSVAIQPYDQPVPVVLTK